MLSARNQIPGVITAIRTDGLMAEVVVDANGTQIVSVITRASAEAMGLQVGVAVSAVVKSTEVMISTP